MTRDPVWERWEEIDPLLASVLDLPPEARAPFLDEHCAGDPELRRALDELVLHAAGSGDRDSRPGTHLLREALTGDASQARRQAEDRVGTTLGPYRLVEVLGVGGMGTVYLGERDDGLFQRRVAVKLLRLSLDTPGVLERFGLERQILASLSHPGIAQMLDGGVTGDGRPWLVMEYVEGVPIDVYADGRRLGVEERIWLVLAVADAVAYAHRQLVVHRDLKPANILVTPDGQVKLLDFGVAKLLDPEAGPGGATTRADARFLTPEYAAPEQIRSQAVGTATDVHALGALLHELLTGKRPFRVASGSSFDLQRAVLETTPLLPSVEVVRRTDREGDPGPDPAEVAERRGTTPAKLARELAGDLDAVVARALRKAPEERYASVDALQSDLHNHLTGRPVAAREGLWAYRARKFLRRNWLPVGGAAGLVLLLAAFTLALARAQTVTARERDRAETEAENARLVVDFLADVFRGRDPDQAPPDTITARELVAWGVERVDREFGDRPEIQADLLLVLANAWSNLGRPDDGMALLDRALEIRRARFGAGSWEAAEVHLAQAALLRTNSRGMEALEPAREALAVARAVHEPETPKMADALQALGWAWVDQDQPDSALVLLEEALRIRQGRPEEEAHLVEAQLALAFALRRAGRLDEAEALYEEAIPRYRALPEARTSQMATYLNNLAFLRSRRGDRAAAEALYRESLEILQGTLGPGHPRSMSTAGNLASVLHDMGRLPEARAVLEARVAAVEAEWPEGHWRVTRARQSVADLILRTGETREAEPLHRAVAEDYADRLGPQHYWTSFAWARIAVIRLLDGDTVPGKTFLNRLHGAMAQEREAAGGRLTPAHHDLTENFVYVLGDTGPPEELARFSELLGDGTGR